MLQIFVQNNMENLNFGHIYLAMPMRYDAIKYSNISLDKDISFI